jgi:hypothetical protein
LSQALRLLDELLAKNTPEKKKSKTGHVLVFYRWDLSQVFLCPPLSCVLRLASCVSDSRSRSAISCTRWTLDTPTIPPQYSYSTHAYDLYICLIDWGFGLDLFPCSFVLCCRPFVFRECSRKVGVEDDGVCAPWESRAVSLAFLPPSSSESIRSSFIRPQGSWRDMC